MLPTFVLVFSVGLGLRRLLFVVTETASDDVGTSVVEITRGALVRAENKAPFLEADLMGDFVVLLTDDGR